MAEFIILLLFSLLSIIIFILVRFYNIFILKLKYGSYRHQYYLSTNPDSSKFLNPVYL